MQILQPSAWSVTWGRFQLMGQFAKHVQLAQSQRVRELVNVTHVKPGLGQMEIQSASYAIQGITRPMEALA